MKVKGSDPLISIAARLARCDLLTELEEICENQQTIKTSVLQDVVDRASNKLKKEAIYVRNTFNMINGF